MAAPVRIAIITFTGSASPLSAPGVQPGDFVLQAIELSPTPGADLTTALDPFAPTGATLVASSGNIAAGTTALVLIQPHA